MLKSKILSEISLVVLLIAAYLITGLQHNYKTTTLMSWKEVINMTNLQIAYWNLQETARHNLAYEEETQRHNIAGEAETQRHNRATEGLQWSTLQETTRHNLATEYVAQGQLAVSQGQLALGWSQLGETSRHNRATEAAAYMQASASQLSASAAMTNARTNAMLGEYQKGLIAQQTLESASRVTANEAAANLSNARSAQVASQTKWQDIQNYIYGGTAADNAHAYQIMKPSLDAFSDVTSAFGGLVGGFSRGTTVMSQGDYSYQVDMFGNVIG